MAVELDVRPQDRFHLNPTSDRAGNVAFARKQFRQALAISPLADSPTIHAAMSVSDRYRELLMRVNRWSDFLPICDDIDMNVAGHQYRQSQHTLEAVLRDWRYTKFRRNEVEMLLTGALIHDIGEAGPLLDQTEEAQVRDISYVDKHKSRQALFIEEAKELTAAQRMIDESGVDDRLKPYLREAHWVIGTELTPRQIAKLGFNPSRVYPESNRRWMLRSRWGLYEKYGYAATAAQQLEVLPTDGLGITSEDYYRLHFWPPKQFALARDLGAPSSEETVRLALYKAAIHPDVKEAAIQGIPSAMIFIQEALWRVSRASVALNVDLDLKGMASNL